MRADAVESAGSPAPPSVDELLGRVERLEASVGFLLELVELAGEQAPQPASGPDPLVTALGQLRQRREARRT